MEVVGLGRRASCYSIDGTATTSNPWAGSKREGGKLGAASEPTHHLDPVVQKLEPSMFGGTKSCQSFFVNRRISCEVAGEGLGQPTTLMIAIPAKTAVAAEERGVYPFVFWRRFNLREPAPAELALVELSETPLSSDTIHDLHTIGRSRYGAEQPISPSPGFVHKARPHEGVERVGGIADPAKPVVLVANPADLFRQGSGSGPYNAAGLVVSESFQRDYRTQSRFGIGSVEGVLARLVLPPSVTFSTTAAASGGLGRVPKEWDHVSAKGTVWPSSISKSARVLRSSPRSATRVPKTI